ncbi:Translation initiation factor 3 subunit J component [Ophidiomyces ophidiicola]|uniref:Translation initiation factor 3 subunit J component n=1 Tax=Ophidiomyces ophidiicola TaxID=1387563 RepID=UPI0020C563F8|nr:Translation initiation factor 3 subunit J component [Ophidiomyces ophidiicola]KAI1914729.1 Translation initiation factor 3 subunit J component [Ophidiomyces ophidiicola]KAI1933427.1 Translation initiation factor 3 subunit J component [Ophidiomyces ophidiicola]KAI1938378.1 Translation initiation factor 3 subunit J component [Ophidiomyces ophidiicola]KAI1945054.1 Translation initiation factor 3 subunit J component [Ophidiomyces ophidiicola]KAI1949461.1 Translation initiation factor 3 subunit 
MAPSKWDDEEESTPPSSPPLAPVARRKFDDEEDSDEVLESWDAAEDSEVEREKQAKEAAAKVKAEAEAAAKKKSKAERIQEHKVRRLANQDDESSEEEEDAATMRARLKRTEQDADLMHAEDLMGNIDINRSRSAPKKSVISDKDDPTKSIDLSAIPLFKPATKAQFALLTETLAPLLAAQSKKPQYSLWVQEFTKQLVKELPSTEIKKVASALTAASNEKMKEEKAADKGGKKSKAAKTKTSLVTSHANRADLTAYDGEDLDDDDFM